MGAKERELRAWLLMIKARYDYESVSPGMFAVIRKMETDISHLASSRSPG